MKARIPGLVTLLLLIISLAGCASATLEIESSIYTAEPVLASRLSQTDLLRLHVSVDAAQSEAFRLKEARLRLSEATLRAIRDYLCLIRKTVNPKFTCSDEVIAELLKEKPIYEAKLESQVSLIADSAKEIREAIVEYDRILKASTLAPQETSKLVASRDRILAATRSLEMQILSLGPVGFDTDFEKYTKAYLQRAPKALDAKNLEVLGVQKLSASLNSDAQALATSLEALAVELARQEKDGLRAASNLSAELRQSAKGIQNAGAGFSRSVAAGAAALSKVNIDLRADAGTLAIANIAESLDFYNSQVDRLQDPADPVWREVTDPKNADKWNSTFARTLFYAEGNTGVVVVRDRAGQFRVHQAKNNPTALIQGQLRVSRAVTSGLTDVLGALTGASGLTGVLPGGKADSQTDSVAKVESIAEGDAKVRAEDERRRTARANLLRNLERVNSQLQSVPNDDPKIKDLATQIRAILNGHKPLFEPKPE